MTVKVVVKHGNDPAALAYEAIARVFVDEVQGKKVLLKPNVGRNSPAGTGVCTHPEVIRGLIRFFQEKQAKTIYVGDGPLFGVDEWEALASSGIKQVCEETGAICVNLDEFSELDIVIPQGVIVDKLKFTSLIKEVDLIVSVPVMKTHMYTGVTLSVKNMKGCLYKKEKTKLHRIFKEPPDKSKGLTLDYGIADMASVLLPDYAVIDGITCMEGFGPSVGTPVNLNVVLASRDPVACDLVAVKLMGMDWEDIPHLNLIRERQNKPLISEIDVEPADFMKYGKLFAKASLSNLKVVYPKINIVEKGSCSACSAAMMAFLKTHGDKFKDWEEFTLLAGKDLQQEDLRKKCYLIGNCTANLAKKNNLTFCKGCPPVGSSILSFINVSKNE